MPSPPYILAIESSCDDTSAAVLHGSTVLSNVISTQAVHEEYGGVVPELASRAHQKNIVPTVSVALKKAGIETQQLDALAFTRGPGLMGSLLVGTSFIKGLAIALKKPLIEVNHMRGHVLAHFIANQEKHPEFPFLCLTVSGGHTQIVKITSPYNFEILGETRDDAAGEAFDKIAKIIGLPYPGGPLVDKHAKIGNPERFKFPIANIPNFDFSFSGLKTSVLYFLQKEIAKDPKFVDDNLNDICASVQHTIIKTLFQKLEKAAKQTGIKQVAIAGGVSANSLLRSELTSREKKLGWQTYIPTFEYCTDNAAMIGIAAYFKYLKNDFTDLSVIPQARLEIE